MATNHSPVLCWTLIIVVYQKTVLVLKMWLIVLFENGKPPLGSKANLARAEEIPAIFFYLLRRLIHLLLPQVEACNWSPNPLSFLNTAPGEWCKFLFQLGKSRLMALLKVHPPFHTTTLMFGTMANVWSSSPGLETPYLAILALTQRRRRKRCFLFGPKYFLLQIPRWFWALTQGFVFILKQIITDNPQTPKYG